MFPKNKLDFFFIMDFLDSFSKGLKLKKKYKKILSFLVKLMNEMGKTGVSMLFNIFYIQA